MNKQQTLSEQKDAILLLIEYAAPKEEIDSAKELVNTYQADRIALNLFQEFYSYLPEAEDDVIKRIQLIEGKKRVFLLLVTTNIDTYIYMASLDKAVFLGRHGDGIWDNDVLEYFQTSREEAIKRLKNPAVFQDYLSIDQSDSHCKICSAAIGEEHRLGCPVEICPWCDNQLTSCNCRFSQLAEEKITTTKQVELFNEKLFKKGRIPFDLSQQPGGLLELEKDRLRSLAGSLT